MHRMHKGVNRNESTGYEKNSLRQIVCMYSSLNCHRHFLILTTIKIKRHSFNVPIKSRTFIAALPIFGEKLLAPPWQAIQIVPAIEFGAITSNYSLWNSKSFQVISASP